jgi:hypothetical protein
VTQCPIVPGNAFEYRFDVPDQAVRCDCAIAAGTREYDISRAHSGTTVTFLTSIVTACGVHLLCEIPTIHKQSSMTLMMARKI